MFVNTAVPILNPFIFPSAKPSLQCKFADQGAALEAPFVTWLFSVVLGQLASRFELAHLKPKEVEVS
jgi:hypothetical protein